MAKLIELWQRIMDILVGIGDWVGLLPLRLILAWEFWEAGKMKLGGDNWFESAKDNFPFPFNVVPTEFSWFLATWTEVLGGIGLALGLFTRFWAAGFVILTLVAMFGVHWPAEWSSLSELWKGFAVSNKGFGNYKLPLIYLTMLLPLLLHGAGKISLDNLLSKFLVKKH